MQCTMKASSSEGKARSREDEMRRCRPGFLLVGFDAEASIPRTGCNCFLSAFVNLLRTLPKEVSRSTATKVESGISDAHRRCLVSERRVKKHRTLVEKVQIEFDSTEGS